ncbi:acyl-CoA synthetase (AMP-forming)/AMP-acid ligase II [Arthrobacter sp. PL16]|uniref:AMP-binding protein n=1 Tax=Arthrobacter sp. PL16 TaxID=3071720 RepID=UPI002DFC7BC7|nr:acyl-CoA synthetase (AMP-forming)/AMP-acid ligase II [Arthrobacter sp. PL16]
MSLDPDLSEATFTDLIRYGDRPAILTAGGVLSYRELAARVDDVVVRLGAERRLVLLAARNDVETLVAYLAAISAGHPLLLVPADKPAAVDSLVAAYEPDVVMETVDGSLHLDERWPGTRHELHPDLALLLSTSGSTGSPKLVRLSRRNLEENARSIAQYLGIGPDDRAATTLPFSYCYGLSVINSHLMQGAGLVLTDLSVVDPCFWEVFRERSATSFAAVPYSFDLLDRVGFAEMDLPNLRYVTQAGGRLAPEKVRSWAETGQRRGWDLFVMYGATEATARMAYLPPDLAAEYPGTIGVPVPCGSFRIDPVDGLPHGELVYTGPNVMLGYAESLEDLALGRTIDELRTGDLARRNANGLYEVVGRKSRFVKIAGLRVDLGQVEQILSGMGVAAAATGSDDDGLVIAVEGEHDTALLTKVLVSDLGLPRASVRLHAVERLPRLSTGKIDYPAVRGLAAPRPADPADHGPAREGPADVPRIFAECLDRPDVKASDTFVTLDGDSLSYVALSVRLEAALGRLPSGWHLRTVGELSRRGKPRHRRLVSFLEPSIVLRAVATICIVAAHVELFTFHTAHLLFVVAGFNFARFQLTGTRSERLRRHARSLTKIVVPSVAFIAVAYLLTDDYSIANIFLLNGMVGPQEVTSEWHFWFVEMLVYVLIAVTALLAVPWLDRLERRAPFAFALGLVAITLLSRYDIVDPGLPKPLPVFWLFALGWAVARADGTVGRLLVSALAVLTVPGFFDHTLREATIVVGLLLITWVPALPVPSVLRRVTGWLAAASLYIYLTHWLVYPVLLPISPVLAVVGCLPVGVGYWALCRWLPIAFARWRRRREAVVPEPVDA